MAFALLLDMAVGRLVSSGKTRVFDLGKSGEQMGCLSLLVSI
jgi:hypothetical protein